MLLNHIKVTKPTLWGNILCYHEKFVENFAYFHFSVFFFNPHLDFVIKPSILSGFTTYEGAYKFNLVQNKHI